MCTIALAKVQRNYNCYNVYFYECLLFAKIGIISETSKHNASKFGKRCKNKECESDYRKHSINYM